MDGRWSAAQIGWHVAAVNTRFAALIAGDVPAAKPLPPEFVERPWAEIVAAIPGKLEAATAATPPPGVTRHDAIAALESSAVKMARALDTLPPERGARIGVRVRWSGRSICTRSANWAAAHVERHYAQVQRALSARQWC